MNGKEIYDAMERDVGISAYLSKEHSGFAAVVKARISDFVVHEGTTAVCDILVSGCCH